MDVVAWFVRSFVLSFSHTKTNLPPFDLTVANTWKQLDSGAKVVFNERAALEKEAYKRALQMWTQNTKKSPSPESDKATMPQGAHTYSPIQLPLKPPEPALGRLSAEGLRDDSHYGVAQHPRMEQNQVPKPMTQTSRIGSIYGSSGVPSIRGGSSSGGSIASVEVAYRPHATATFSAAMNDRPQPSQMFSDERTRLVDAALDAGPSLLTQQIFRRQSTPDYPARNGGQMMSSFNQQSYRRQSTPEFPARPIDAEQRYSVEQASFVRPETTQQQAEFAQWYQRWPPQMYASAASGIDSNEQGRQQQWGSQYEESFDQEYPYAGRVATVGSGDRVLFQGHPQHPQPAHLPRQSFKSHRHVDSGEELQEVIAAPTEGPESPEEEEEMNRLLMSYEEK